MIFFFSRWILLLSNKNMSKKCFNDLLDEKWSKMWTWETFFIRFSGYNIPKSLMCYGRKKFCRILACYFRQICFQNIGINFFWENVEIDRGLFSDRKISPRKIHSGRLPPAPLQQTPLWFRVTVCDRVRAGGNLLVGNFPSTLFPVRITRSYWIFDLLIK